MFHNGMSTAWEKYTYQEKTLLIPIKVETEYEISTNSMVVWITIPMTHQHAIDEALLTLDRV